MRGFFNGWRRKLGCVTLVMACVLMGGWVRSLTFFEGVSLPLGRMPNKFLVSWDSSLVWLTEYAGVVGPYPEYKCRRIAGVDDRIFESPHAQWRWQWCGFGFGVGVDEIKVGNRIERNTLTVIPYWSVTIPMTLASLLATALKVWVFESWAGVSEDGVLSKPRVAKPKSVGEN